ncbi:MAG: type II secretion system F family protein [Bacteroidetes bacterium]|nr:type II secretion system F family protein [Bacteroidota bacterium]
MPKYEYIGKLVDGQQVEGIQRAESTEDLQNILLKNGIFLSSHSISKSKVSQYITRSLRGKDITRMTRQLAALSESSITFKDSLESVREQVSDKAIGEMMDSISRSIESGKSIADSFRQFPILFDTLFTSMIEAGEISGTIDVSLDRIATYRERSDETNRKIRSALAYPLLVLAVTLLVVFILVIYIIPIFASMYANFGTELPQLTQYVVSASEWAQENIGFFIAIVFIGIIGAVFTLLNERMRYFLSALQLRIPFIGRIQKKIINARFSRTLGTLLQSGVPTLFSVEIAVKTTGNAYIQHKIVDLISLLSQGKSFTEAVGNYSIFSKTVIRMAAAGEKTGQLGKMLSKAADFFESEIDHEIGTLTTLFEPLIIIFLGVFIAFILVAMYLPLFDLMSAM